MKQMIPSHCGVIHLLYANNSHIQNTLYANNGNGHNSCLLSSLHSAFSCMASFVSQGCFLGVAIVISISQMRKLRPRDGRVLPVALTLGVVENVLRYSPLAPDPMLRGKVLSAAPLTLLWVENLSIS